MKKLSYVFISTTVLTMAACSPLIEEKPLEPSSQVSQNNQPLSLPEREVKIDESHVLSERALKDDYDKKQPARTSGDQMQSIAKQMAGVSVVPANIRQTVESLNSEKYAHFADNGIQLVTQNPVSTFSIDVDTGSYSNARRMLNAGQLPRKDAVRVEEFINYFSYEEQPLADTDAPFSVFTEVGPSPWNKNTHLMRVSLKATALQKNELASNNLVFLVDVSGSMHSADKLGLLKKSLKLLGRQMGKNDRITIVVYAGASGMALETTAGNETLKIEQAINALEAGGSTNGAAGIQLAYQAAQEAFIKAGNNRVILATDGDFNVGTVDHNALMDLIEKQTEQGIYLTTLGFGTGNYNDHLMEQLADHGNGNYAYIDNLMEAKKVLVDEMGATLQTVAKDVKIQVEFNPEQISEYRLIGYENRQLEREDFNNDRVDAGEIGAGHSVTALYEVSMHASSGRIDPLRYAGQPDIHIDSQQQSSELAYVKLRYKTLESNQSSLLTFPVKLENVKDKLDQTSHNFRFASAVAAFGQKLRGGKYLDHYTYQDIRQLAQQSRGQDKHGLRSNFLQLVGLTETLDMKVSSR